jgi:ER lumen protein retaining receptor
VVFLTRYTDLVTHFVSLYNTTMKLFFISSSLYIVYLMKVKFKATNDPRLDTFQVQYVVGGAALLALIANYAFTFQEVLFNSLMRIPYACDDSFLYRIRPTGGEGSTDILRDPP